MMVYSWFMASPVPFLLAVSSDCHHFHTVFMSHNDLLPAVLLKNVSVNFTFGDNVMCSSSRVCQCFCCISEVHCRECEEGISVSLYVVFCSWNTGKYPVLPNVCFTCECLEQCMCCCIDSDMERTPAFLDSFTRRLLTLEESVNWADLQVHVISTPKCIFQLLLCLTSV